MLKEHNCDTDYNDILPSSSSLAGTFTKCTMCDVRVFSREGAEKHYKLEHGVSIPPEFKIKPRKKTFKMQPEICDKCNMEFSGRRYLHLHYTSVHKELLPDYQQKEKFVCEICSKILFSQYRLAEHLKSCGLEAHKRAPPNVTYKECPHCQKRFAKHSVLSEHIKTKHEFVTPFQCDKCDKKFGTYATMAQHIRQKHQRVKCDICTQEICNLFILKRHKATVHGVTPENVLKCDHCPLFFESDRTFRKHMDKQHPSLDLTRIEQLL